jgi:hypothetical protein
MIVVGRSNNPVGRRGDVMLLPIILIVALVMLVVAGIRRRRFRRFRRRLIRRRVL